MLSMVPIKSSTDARKYFEHDNYYVKDSPEYAGTSKWIGRGAAELGLNGPVALDTFESLLQGKLPSGEQLGRVEKNQKHHRPGYDLTFSAPKSVSILAEIGGDNRLIVAHTRSVEKAMHYLDVVAQT